MAGVFPIGEHKFEIVLDNVEHEVLLMHGSREGLEPGDSLGDLVERALGIVTAEIREEEKPLTQGPCEEAITIMFKIAYPKSGPVSTVTPEYKGFVAEQLLNALDMAVGICLSEHHLLEIMHELERADERVGACESAIPEHGRGVSDVSGSGGPDSVEGQVQGQGE